MTEQDHKRQKLDEFTRFVNENANYFVMKLGEIVAIDGVSAEPQRRPKVVETANWLEKHLKGLGANSVKKVDIGYQTEQNTQTDTPTALPLPPVIFAEFKTSIENAKTVCVYGHYDVQPAEKSDGWDTEPFVMTERNGKLFGRGTTDDKGPILCWLWAIHTFREMKTALPVNIKFVFEGMEESGSVGLEKLLLRESADNGGFLAGVDFVCISDNYWLGPTRPCVTYGLRGNVYFTISVKGFEGDLHSGVHGGGVHEPMTDLIHLMSRIVSPTNEILIPGLKEMVEPVTTEELQTYTRMDFDLETYKNDVKLVGKRKLLHEGHKEQTLMHRWRYPCISLHGIEGAFSSKGTKTVIPAKVIGKFSIRTVPDMDSSQVIRLTKDFVEGEFRSLGSPNEMVVECVRAGPWWKSETSDPNHVAAQQAQQAVFGVAPDLTREGGSIPITSTFEKATNKSVVLLPVGACDDAAHSQNEKLNRSNYINGIKVMIAYLNNLGAL